jgi:hypothetical protein
VEASEETHLQHLRSLRYDDYLWDGDVPFGHECCERVGRWSGGSANDNSDSSYTAFATLDDKWHDN